MKKIMKGAKNRVIDNWVTTVLGIVILVFCMIMSAMEKSSVAELSGWFTSAMALIRSKGSIIPGLEAKEPDHE